MSARLYLGYRHWRRLQQLPKFGVADLRGAGQASRPALAEDRLFDGSKRARHRGSSTPRQVRWLQAARLRLAVVRQR